MIFPASRIHYFFDEKKGKKERKKERGRKEGKNSHETVYTPNLTYI